MNANTLTMKRIKIIFVALTLLLPTAAMAQFRQDRSNCEYMFKWDISYAPFVSNAGHPNYDGNYTINEPDLRHQFGASIINGVCLHQDFFVGLGLGYDYLAVPSRLTEGWHSAAAYIDFDYRPLDIPCSPMAYAKGGVNYLLRPEGMSNMLSPYAEIGLGMNWYYNYVLSNMERNYHSLFLTVGVAYYQETIFVPIRLGMRF